MLGFSETLTSNTVGMDDKKLSSVIPPFLFALFFLDTKNT
jgi:hypothetical protein